ncbi:DUF4097 family beta strand repeat protein [Aquibacillus halophilus]|uniref:DUF4097 family beta strand repeat protein n=1 Tax=Aquibacillus halophilus TaxID=930132 RepID=A0A6A8DEI3_9BACI|nr:DUF4097 family beta strand repeat-containing protein [Aquibacillus halophilus]MRH44053.1 DUF4097 family beta strand repeat protein [Aquibacillus halophilus]
MKKVALLAFVFLIIGIIGTVMYGGSVFSIGTNEVIDEKKQIDGADIDSLDINMDVGQVNLYESKDNSFNIHLNGNMPRSTVDNIVFDVKEENNYIIIEVGTREDFVFSIPGLFNFSNGSIELDIELPKKAYDTIEVSTDVGGVMVDQLQVEQLDASTDVGTILINQLISKKALLSSNVGEVVVNGGIGAFTIDTDTGEIGLNMKEVIEPISIRSDVGEIDVTVQKQPVNLVLDLKSDIGDVSVKNLEGFNNSEGQEMYIEIGQGGPTLKASTDVGSISVEHQP